MRRYYQVQLNNEINNYFEILVYLMENLLGLYYIFKIYFHLYLFRKDYILYIIWYVNGVKRMKPKNIFVV